ncbi:damage-inducible protein DinB [Chromobacterium sinusclupearum]|uniref:Damage-inducible protein DinB n=1 Tax=Chromobacterium sinusclupearum TaxID=2077146 RepID=A0A2K4MKD6_9NEIS|nr:DinB family protein [Chromobacterium sinusclupearum]POA97479.1 damage-inducible protein DinB [Chromobacterium sinusclupearum]
MNTALFHSLFRCKSWADEELYAMVATLDAAAHPEKRHAAIRILNHIHVVDRIFRGNLTSQPHGYAATNTPDTPELAELLETARDTDAWYLDHVAGFSAERLSETIHFAFTDGGHGRMSRAEMLLQVITHGGYHRGAVGRILADCGIQPPRDIYTRYLHDNEPARRQPS